VTTPASTHSQSQSPKRLAPGPLRAGFRAPDFRLRCSQYRDAALQDYRGHSLVVVFYVADWRPVCSAQLATYRELYPELTRLGAELVAISTDTVWSHAAFSNAYQLSFPLLADDHPRGNIAQAYGVYDARRQATRRSLFVIDATSRITWTAVFPDAVDPGADGILTAIEELHSTPCTGG
jgi:peroxiredoxin